MFVYFLFAEAINMNDCVTYLLLGWAKYTQTIVSLLIGCPSCTTTCQDCNILCQDCNISCQSCRIVCPGCNGTPCAALRAFSRQQGLDSG